ncbi:MAG: DUF6799 domain-containing protein [Flavobacteriaceae bacterium]
MKKLILSIAFIALGAMAINAQDDTKGNFQSQERFMFVNGDVLQIRDRDQIRLKDKITLNDGTTLNTNGAFQTRNREQLKMQNGECLDQDGILYRNEYQYRYKIQQENKGLTQPQIQERNQNRIHYMLVEGEVFQIRNQFQNRLENEQNLGNGIILRPDGTYQTRNQEQLRLQDGECINMNGEEFKNTYQLRKNEAKRNMVKSKVQKKPPIKKQALKKGN